MASSRFHTTASHEASQARTFSVPSRSPSAFPSLLETLAYANVLNAPEHPGLLEAWQTYAARDQRPSVRVEVDAPLGFWRASHGVNRTAVARLFPSVPQ
jgi:hypothetical protein